MATGSLDSNGVWLYGEDDQRDTFSELLNIGMDSVSDAIGLLRGRATALETAGATSTVTAAGILTAATGWSVTTQQGRKKNGQAFLRYTVSRTGAAVSVPSDGDIANQLLATFAAGWVPASGILYPAASNALVAAGYVDSTGVYLAAVAPGITIPTGQTFGFVATYLPA